MNPEKCQFKYRTGARIIGAIHSIVALGGLLFVGLVALSQSQSYFEFLKFPFIPTQVPDGFYSVVGWLLFVDLLPALGLIFATSRDRNPSTALKLMKPYLAFWLVMPVFAIMGVFVATTGPDRNFKISVECLLAIIALILVLGGFSFTPVNYHGFELRNLVEYLEGPRAEGLSSPSSGPASGVKTCEGDTPKWNFWSVDFFRRRFK